MKPSNSILSLLFSAVLALLLAGCGGGGGSAAPATGGGGTTTPTTVSGKVTLSSTVTGKPAMMKAMLNAPKGKPGSKLYKVSSKASTSNELKLAVLDKALNATAFSGGIVYLYNSDHPEWLSPVASGPTDSAGAYSLTVLANAATNNNAYTDGAAIPAGNYTLLAYKTGGFDPILGITTKALVAIQTVVNNFSGTVTLPDLEALESTSVPTVTAMLGAKQNTDGTQTWGSAATSLPANAAIQVNFSTAMSRGSLTNGITLLPAVSGKWTLSADWTTATFYPASGVSLTVGTAYTITVKGSDTDSTNSVKNVYGNALAKTATGTFTATAVDTAAATAIFISPNMSAAVKVTDPIRIGATKQLDVNGLTLDGKIAGVSSLGAKPGILYVGKDATSSYPYVYEFVLGEPLMLNTTYDLTVSGGKGLNGIAMNSLTGSFTTANAAATSGVDATASTTTQQAQAAVKGVLGKWISAFSDRNITQLKSLMSGDFYFEDSKMDSSDDLNKDGRLSLGEFSDMISLHAFPQWEFCGTTITGDVVGTINVVGDNADFEFKMVATSANTSQRCLDTMPTDSFYATVKKVNGAWTIVRASVGVDTRSKTISFPGLIDNLKLTQNSVLIADGGQIQLPTTYPVTNSWEAAAGVSSYVLIRMDARDPDNGKACALPSTVISFSPATTTSCVDAGGTGVGGKFGFNTSTTTAPFLVEGGQYYWEVIGLKTITVSTITGKTSKEMLKDISAISALKSFSVAGVYKEITAQVYAGASATGTPVTYSVNYDGYDVGSANQATITITTANTGATSGNMYVSGNYSTSYPLVFSGGAATLTIDLSKGWNWISIDDGAGLWKGFSISTTGGFLPAVDITLVKDDTTGAPTLTGDAWNYYNATTGAKQVTISGTVDLVKLSGVTSVDVNVWNEKSGAYSYVSTPVTPVTTYGTFSVTVDIYPGDNWINAGAGYNDPTYGWIWHGDHIGVYTDTGTVWVPNISITGVATASLTSGYGSSADYDASLDTDGVVTITGKFKNPVNGNYNISSDGGYSNGTLVVLADGSFTLDVTLYNGWNYVSLSDSNYNWYGVNIYTTTGKTAVKPTILTVGGVTPTVNLGGASAAVTGCTATVTGTAKPGNLYVYWNGFDGANYNYENQNLVLTGTPDTATPFSFSVPLVSGSGSYNNIDVYDLNWMWTGVKVTTSGACTYSPPVMTLSSVTDGSITIIADTFGYYNVATSTITVSGTSDRPGRTITLSSYACTSQSYTTTADGSGNWSFSGIPVYDGYNYPSISDGYNSQYITVYAANAQFAVPVLTASVSGLTPTYTGSCGYKQWDAGTAATVTITGTTTAPDGTGYYTDATGGNHPFTITGGNYTITGVTVYGNTVGEWNYIYLNDTAWNYQQVTIYSTNTASKPKFVNITTPVNTNTLPFTTGLQGVTGTITDPVASGYAPSVVRAQMGVWNNVTSTYTYTYYSSNADDQNVYGDSAITYDATTGNYSFQADFGTGSYTYIHVYAYDDVTYASHGMQMYYNDGTTGSTGYSSYYKPGAKAKSAVGNPSVASEMMKQQLKSINRNR